MTAMGIGCVGAAWGVGVGAAASWMALSAGGGGRGSPVGVGERDTAPVPVEGSLLLASTCSARRLGTTDYLLETDPDSTVRERRRVTARDADQVGSELQRSFGLSSSTYLAGVACASGIFGGPLSGS